MAKLHVSLRKLQENFARARGLCDHLGVELLPVTKLVLSHPGMLSGLPGLQRVADVHVANLRRAKDELGLGTELMRVRHADLAALGRSCDVVFLSDPCMARDLSAARTAAGLAGVAPLPVVLHLEYGDLRDGVPLDEAAGVLRGIAGLPGLRPEGVAVNLGCLDGVLPDGDTLGRIASDLLRLRRETGLGLPRCSVGGSLFLSWLDGVAVPGEISELRLGESWLCGTCATTAEQYAGFHDDVFRLELEVLETWTKEVRGNGEGRNAQGGQTVEPFRGRRLRAVLEGGENAAPFSDLRPLEDGVVVIGATHEYTVADVQGMDTPPRCGDTLSFRPGYEAVTQAVLSPFVEICLCEE